MIAAWRTWVGEPARNSDRIAASLGLFAGHPAAFWRDDSTGYAYLPAPRLYAPIRAWRPSHSPSGAVVLFHGRIDNSVELADILGVGASDPAVVYGAAIDRWGDEADHRVVGTYAAILVTQAELRLARSPWDAPPLHYCRFNGQAVAASVLRVLLSAGLPPKLDQTRLADNLFFNLSDRDRGWYENAREVRQGSIVHLGSDRVRQVDWYDPDAIDRVCLRSDDEYLEAANALLAEAVSKALRHTSKPAVSLSGGLDSQIMVDEVLRQLPPNARLHSYTSVPDPEWDGIVPSGYFGDERPFVEAFAKRHPRLITHFTANPDTGFDARWNDFFLAMGAAPNHLCNYQAYHGVWAGARDTGCDALLSAEFGNQTYSNDARWAYVEYFLRLRWGELVHALKNRPDDKRSLVRKFLALSVLRLMPRAIREEVQRLLHPGRGSINELVSFLDPSEIKAATERAHAAGALIGHGYPASQRSSNRIEFLWADAHGTDVELAFEQIYGLKQINVPTYRPLVEFCMGLPTGQFLRRGTTRWLARRMAAGRLPDEVRNNRTQGLHNSDWHLRMKRRLPELRAEITQMASNADLQPLLDTDRMATMLDNWPERTPSEPEIRYPLAAGIPRSLLTVRFIDYVEQRNVV